MRLVKLTLLFVIITFLLNSSLAWTSGQIVHLDGDRLTLDVKNQSLSLILAELAEQGVRIRVDPRINPEISATFDNRPIGSALSSILRSFDYALIWEKNSGSSTDEPELKEIQIFYEGQEARIRQLEKSVNLNVVQQGDGTYRVKDLLLLKLAPTMTESAFAALVEQLGATILEAHSPSGIIKLRLPPGTDVQMIAKIISSYPGVQTAEPDYAYPTEGSNPILMSEPVAFEPSVPVPAAGTATVAVMDSGLLPDYQNNPFVIGTYDAVSPGSVVNDRVGHGTQMTLIAAGAVNPLGVGGDTTATSPVLVIRAIDDNGFTSNYTLIRGIDYAIENKAQVLSLSWGSETPSPLLESTTRYATANGLILVAAAGNEPTGRPVYPAAYENVIGVGALTPNGTPWDKSNYGDFVAVQAPGLADLPVGYQGDPGTYAGTSIATAYTAHRVAAIRDLQPNADLDTILQQLSTGVEFSYD